MYNAVHTAMSGATNATLMTNNKVEAHPLIASEASAATSAAKSAHCAAPWACHSGVEEEKL